MTEQPRWRLVEGVVAALERVLAPVGATITPNAHVPYRDDPTRTRQVDVHLLIPAGPRALTVGVEVKDENKAMPVDEVEGVAAKLAKLQLDRRCLVSVSGFSENAKRDALAAGLQLLTIEELEGVTWWHGPMSMPVFTRSVEPVIVRVDYDAETCEAIAREFPSLPVAESVLVGSDGSTATLHAYAVHHGIKALEEPAADSLTDGSLYQVTVNASPGAWAALRVGDRELPPPDRILMGFRLHASWSEVPIGSYGLHDHQALTTTLELGGTAVQLTMVGRAGDFPGSVSGLQLVSAPAVPRKRRV